MPVETTEPHPMTVRHEGHKASCYNRGELRDGYFAQDGNIKHTLIEWAPNIDWIPHRMSTKCRQGVYETLPECEGCQAPKDLEYIERMRGVK